MFKWSMVVRAVLSIVAVASLSGCPSSKSSDNNGILSGKITVSGSVAGDSPMAGALISIKDVNGSTASVTTSVDETYTLDVTNMTAPLLVQASIPAGGYLYGVATTATTTTTANVHPLSDMIVRDWYKKQGGDVGTAFASAGAMPTPPTATEIDKREGVVRQTLATVMRGADVNPASFNLITTPFSANHTGFDLVLDNLTVKQPLASGGDVTIGLIGGGTSGNILTVGDSALTSITPPPAPMSDTVSPTVPGAITATRIASTQAVLSWGAATDTQLAGYKIYRSGIQVGITDQSFYIDGAAPLSNACYTVSAYDAAGNDSAQNSEVCATAGTADTTPPSAPGLTATAASSSRIDLTWTASTDDVALAGYRVMVGGSAIASLPDTTITYSHTGLNELTQYNYTVVAIDTSGNATSSPVASATTLFKTDTTAPTNPTGFAATVISDSRIDLAWTASTDNVAVAGYNVYVGTTLVGTNTATSFSGVSLTAGTQYCYTVKAYDAANNLSAASAQVCATTSNALVGTWFAADGTSYTFKADGTYTGWYPGPNGDGSGGYGYEQGTYTWNSATGAFTGYDVTHSKPMTSATVVTVTGDTLLFDGVWSFTRSTTPSTIVGSWYVAGNTNNVLTFFANGDYMHAKSVTTNVGATPGIEHGKYTWDAATGAFAGACPPDVDTNGVDGFSHPNGVACTGSTSTAGTATVSGNTMSWTVNGNPTATLTRLIDTTNPLVGSWALEGSTTVAIEFFANGDYMQAQSVVDPAQAAVAWPGLEHGTYTWNSGTGAFSTGGCPPIDTNGEAGFSHPGGIGCAANSGTITVSGNELTFDYIENGVPGKTVVTRITEQPVLPAQTFTEYTLPAGSQPFGIVSGPDGNLWFTDGGKNSIGKMTPAGVVTEYTIPTTTAAPCSSCPQTIVNGPDGNLWFVEGDGNNIAKITTAGVISEYPNTAGGWPQDLAVGPDGNIWFTDQGVLGGGAAGVNANGAVGMVNVATGVVTKYPLLTASTQANFITLGPDGAMWFTQDGGSTNVARVDMTGNITQFANTGGAFIKTGSDGNLWVTAPIQVAGAIGKLTTAGVQTNIAITSASLVPFSITAAPDGKLWFSEINGLWPGWTGGGNLANITTSGAVSEIALPAAVGANSSMPSVGIVTVGFDGAIWFADPNSSRIVRFHP